MKHYLLLAVLCLGSAFAKAQQPKIWTLQECVQYALDNNIDIKQSVLTLENIELDKRAAIGSFLPSLNASVSNAWNTGLTQNIVTGVLENQVTRNSSYSITSGVTLFDGLRNVYQLQRAKMNILATQYNNEQIEDNLLLNVSNAYLNVLFNKEAVTQLENQNAVTQQQIDQTSELVEAGSLPRGDLLEVKATYAQGVQQVLAAQNQVLVSKIALAQILNIADYENFDVADPNLEDPEAFVLDEGVNNIYDNAVQTRYEIKIAEQNTALAEQDLKIARGARLPSIDAFFNYNTRETDRDLVNGWIKQLYLNDGISYGLRLSVPIFNQFNVSNRVKRAKVAIESNKLLETQAKLDLERNIYQAFNDALASRATFESSQSALEARELAFDYAKERYDVGMMNAFDFNQAQTTLTNAQIDLLRNKYDYVFKLKVLELFNGIEAENLKF
ncbi:MAG: TolC family protein [Nonlabens sp.]